MPRRDRPSRPGATARPPSRSRPPTGCSPPAPTRNAPRRARPRARQGWDDPAVSGAVAAGGGGAARAMPPACRGRPQSSRRRLLAAWWDLRAGRLADAHTGLAAAGEVPLLRRDALLAAAVTIGLARRTGDEAALRATWHRVAPVLHGADVELLLLEAWGELSAGAALVAPGEKDVIVEAMSAAVARAGNPAWAAAAEAWWSLHRAVAGHHPGAAP